MAPLLLEAESSRIEREAGEGGTGVAEGGPPRVPDEICRDTAHASQ